MPAPTTHSSPTLGNPVALGPLSVSVSVSDVCTIPSATHAPPLHSVPSGHADNSTTLLWLHIPISLLLRHMVIESQYSPISANPDDGVSDGILMADDDSVEVVGS